MGVRGILIKKGAKDDDRVIQMDVVGENTKIRSPNYYGKRIRHSELRLDEFHLQGKGRTRS